MRLASLAWKNLQRRPVRSLLTMFGLAIAVAAVVSLVGVARSLETSFLDLYNQRGADVVVQRRGGAVQLAKGISLAFGDRIRALPHVTEVIGGLMDMVAFEDQGLFMVIVNGWEPNSPVLARVTVISGRRLFAGDGHRVMLGRLLAANLNKTTGDSVMLYGQPFEVVGVFQSFSVYENGAAFLLLDELQRQMDRPGQVTGFVVKSTAHGDPAMARTLCAEIEALDPQIAATPCAEFVASLTQMKVTRGMSWVTAVVAGIVGAIGVLNTIAMSVFERRGEIGALRAMGWKKSRVVRLIVTEALLLAAAGAIIGVALGLVIVEFLAHWHGTSGLVQGDISLWSIFVGTLMAMVMAVVGAILPAVRTASRSPVESLRGVG